MLSITASCGKSFLHICNTLNCAFFVIRQIAFANSI
nr:MAG TPA: hypothetical protein [Caudoviricetes sp.]